MADRKNKGEVSSDDEEKPKSDKSAKKGNKKIKKLRRNIFSA